MESKVPSHYKWVKQLAAIGPYLRECRSREGAYFFDCLSVCISAKKAPDRREFYGWWFTLTQQGDAFVYSYSYGVFDGNSDWHHREIPSRHQEEVERSLLEFFQKLREQVEAESGLKLAPAGELDAKFHLTAA